MIWNGVFIFLGSYFIVMNSQVNKFQFQPNLPVGPYKIRLTEFFPYESTVNHKIAINCHLSRKSINITKIVGNITNKIPVDNNLGIDFNMAVMSSIGGWKDNAYVLKVKDNALDTIKRLLGKFFILLLESFKMPVSGFIPPDTYISSGLNRDTINNNSLPKSFFYGKYRAILKLKNADDVLMGCVMLVMDILRLWET